MNIKTEISVVSTEFLVKPARKVFSTFTKSDTDASLNKNKRFFQYVVQKKEQTYLEKCSFRQRISQSKDA